MEFSRREHWSGSPFPSPGDLPNPGIKPRSPALQADSLPAEPRGKPKNTGVGSLPLLQDGLEDPTPPLVDPPDPGIQPGSPALRADSLSTELSGKPFDTESTLNHCSSCNLHASVKLNESISLL